MILGRVTTDRNDAYFEFTVLIIKQGSFLSSLREELDYTRCVDISTDTLTGASFTDH